jgi:hypothetical protein
MHVPPEVFNNDARWKGVIFWSAATIRQLLQSHNNIADVSSMAGVTSFKVMGREWEKGEKEINGLNGRRKVEMG